MRRYLPARTYVVCSAVSSRTNPIASETSKLVGDDVNKKMDASQRDHLMEPIITEDTEDAFKKCALKPEYEHTLMGRILQCVSPETAILTALLSSVIFAAIWMSILVDHWNEISSGTAWAILLVIFSFLGNILSVFVIYAHQPQKQSLSEQKSFKVSHRSRFSSEVIILKGSQKAM